MLTMQQTLNLQTQSFGVNQTNYILPDMNQYPLTPPMDSPDSLFSPASGSSSPPQGYFNQTSNYHQHNANTGGTDPYLSMVEEPVERFRFRYKSEMAGTHGSLSGRTSDRGRKQTFPSVTLHNFNRPAVVRCSLYQFGPKDMEHLRRPHAHRLVKRNGAIEYDDPHSVEVNDESGYTANFDSMGIIHTAKKFIVPELHKKNTELKKEEVARECRSYRPLNKKEEYYVKELAEKEAKTINLNIVCLRFEAFEVINNIHYPLCSPIYSNAINNLKSALTGDLKIVRMDHCSSPCRGGREIFIFVEKVTKKNIKIRFYELDNDNEIWSDYGRFSDMDVHHQYAIAFKTPPYRNLEIDRQVRVFIELERPSDGSRSEPKEFTYTPCEITMGRKRTRYADSYNSSFSSSDVPLTVNDQNGISSLDLKINSGDLLQAALNKGCDSEEFRTWCNEIMESGNFEAFDNRDLNYQETMSLHTDGPSLPTDVTPIVNTMNSNDRFIPHLKTFEKNIIKKVEKELVPFLKTKPTKERLCIMFSKLFSNSEYISEDNNSILHLLIMDNNPFLKLFLRILLDFRTDNIINRQNNKGKTPLHLAVEFCNVVVECLLLAKADLCIQDHEGNTALHSALINNLPISVLKLLICKQAADISNFDGLVPLHLAVKNHNLPAVKLLWLRSADINMCDEKNGRTSLHMAVEEDQLEIVEFLLGKAEIAPAAEDFGQCTAFKLAQSLISNERPKSIKIYNLLESVMKTHGMFEEIVVKEELQDSSDDEMMDYVECPIKSEPLSPNSLKVKYNQIDRFTEDCLNEVCELLDKSGHWQNLADLLDHTDILKSSNLFKTTSTPSRSLLNFAIANGDTVLQIRDFLEHLDEFRAVELIDNMVQLH